MLGELITCVSVGSNAPPANASPSSSSTKAAPPAAGATFQDTISSMQSKLRSSEASHKPPSSADANGDPFAALMAQMEALGAGPGDFGAEGEEGLPGMLDGLMDQLMSRELLEEPIMELRTKVRVTYGQRAALRPKLMNDSVLRSVLLRVSAVPGIPRDSRSERPTCGRAPAVRAAERDRKHHRADVRGSEV